MHETYMQQFKLSAAINFMISPNQELVWQGRIHIGDEPGVYGDSYYAGLCAELPFTVTKIRETESLKIMLETEGMKTFEGYPGHEIYIIAHEKGEHYWTETMLGNGRLSGEGNIFDISIDLSGMESPVFLSLKVRVDTTAPAGLYDDFVIKRISIKSHDQACYASLGFRPLSKWNVVLTEVISEQT